MTREQMAALARQAVADWPPFTEAQRLRVAMLLRPDLPVGIRRPRSGEGDTASDNRSDTRGSPEAA